MDTGIQPSEPQRVQKLWFEDGNIAIQAGNSQFRVYRGILAARSPVFKDMLSFPQPPDSELVDGCPLVRLTDAATEVTAFSKVIFIPEYVLVAASVVRTSHQNLRYFPSFPSLTTFEVIVGCLRLSHKYEVDYLRHRALIHLSSHYPTWLTEWDSGYYDDEINGRLVSEIIWTPLLPSITFLTASAWPAATLLHSARNFSMAPFTTAPQPASINGDDIHTKSAATILGFLLDQLNIPGCGSPSPCSLNRLEALANTEELTVASSPLDVWEEDDWLSLSNVCPTCLALIKRKHAVTRQAFWDNLPDMYELPPWEHLKLAAVGAALM
ncbi:hypothetical protein DFH09DRAFT_1504563 [Mycena vulgaris]|nr:hypothetical protein DFH09DRAFT_1504563 [Mycena vulgaris]